MQGCYAVTFESLTAGVPGGQTAGDSPVIAPVRRRLQARDAANTSVTAEAETDRPGEASRCE
jgi:hypothetical protein